MWKWLVNQETPRQRSMRREFSKVLEEENDKIYIRNSMQMRSSFGAKNNGSSFHWRNLPQMSKENNKHFHIFPEDIQLFKSNWKYNKSNRNGRSTLLTSLLVGVSGVPSPIHKMIKLIITNCAAKNWKNCISIEFPTSMN